MTSERVPGSTKVMPTLIIKDVTDRLLSVLETRAGDNGHALETEVLTILAAAALEYEVSPERFQNKQHRRDTLGELVRESQRLGFYDPPDSLLE